MARTVGEEVMLTTVDNPFNPFTQYTEWFAWDTSHGYHTTVLLARVARVSPDLSEADLSQAEEDAIDEIVEFNVSGMHRKVSSNSYSD